MTPGLAELFATFGRIGLLSFGGPAAQIALMHRELVEGRKWLSEQEYLTALSFCMLLPGPEAMQLATYSGWKLRGTTGGLIAGLLFIIPGALVVLGLSMVYAAYGQVPLIAAAFTGVQAAVVAIVIEALIRVARRALKTQSHWVIAGLAFAALFSLNLPFPAVILTAAIWGFFTTQRQPSTAKIATPWRQSARSAVIWAAIWLGPLAAIMALRPGQLSDIALFFSKLAVLTFGGAYAVLTWMTQTVVQDKAWLTVSQMMDGLGLAETTPGPLILVTEFVGYMAAYKTGGVALGLAAAAITLWMTFAPSFAMVFVGAPWIAGLSQMARLSGALRAITAGVVGVIANLSLWFAAHVFFDDVPTLVKGPFQMIAPRLSSLDPYAVTLALLAGYALLIRHWPLPLVLGLTALAGAIQAIF